MYAVFYFLLGCAMLGGIGMAVANRTADPVTKNERWTKYFVYMLIINLVIISILFRFFVVVAGLIALMGLLEVAWALLRFRPDHILFPILVVTIYAVIAAGFIQFSKKIDRDLQLFIYLQVMIFDAFSQVIGQLVGKRKLVPAISPGKTVEGFIGGFICCIITALSMAHLVELSLAKALLIGSITGIASLAGDLSASWLKRKLRIKDYSNFLPGQGGFLDRFDSLMATACVYLVLLPNGLASFIHTN